MSDVRGFLRFSLPGIACVLQLIVALSITDWSKLSGIIGTSPGAAESFVFVVGVFLASGGLGYFLGLIYWGLYWWKRIAKRYAVDHCTVLNSLTGHIEIRNHEGVEIKPDSLNRRDAWHVVTAYWYSKYKKSDYIKSIQKQIDRIVDITHSVGTTFIGSCLAFIAWALIHVFHSCDRFSFKAGFVLLFWVFLLRCIIWSNYRKALKQLQSTVDSTITEAINAEYANKGRKITIWYADT